MYIYIIVNCGCIQNERYIQQGTERYKDIIANIVDKDEHLINCISLAEFQGLTHRKRWEIFPFMRKIEWTCPNCGNVVPEPSSTLDIIDCEKCGAILTHRTTGGQNNPFYWQFRKINNI